jgi:hypothetical protein
LQTGQCGELSRACRQKKAWVKHIAETPNFGEIIKATYKQVRKTLIAKFNLADVDGQILRVVDVFALFTAVGIEASIDSSGVLMHNVDALEESIHFVFDR